LVAEKTGIINYKEITNANFSISKPSSQGDNLIISVIIPFIAMGISIGFGIYSAIKRK